jgi:hypothetical protein
MKIEIDISSEDEKKFHFVSWSGGCDSTVLLYELCQQLKGKTKPIALISEPWFLTDNKIKSERYHRELIEKEFGKLDISFATTTITSDLLNAYNIPKNDAYGLSQPGLWILQFLTLIPNYSVLHFGYIRTDDFWHYKTEFLKLTEYFCQMLNKKVEIRFDLEYNTKPEIITRLKEIQLLDKTWYCELPNQINVPCNNCVSCKTHQRAIRELNDDDKKEGNNG